MIHLRSLIPVLALPTLLGGCGLFGLSQEDSDRLAYFQENSARYYGAQRYDQALSLVVQGLAIEPRDYKLLSTRAWCHLRQVDDRPGLLPLCEEMFDDLYATRDPSSHGAPALLGQAETQKRLGVRHWERMRDFEDAASSATDVGQRAVSTAKSEEHSVRAAHHFSRSKEALKMLIDNQMSLRVAHKQLMDIAAAQGDYQRAVRHGLRCLEYSAEDQKNLRDVIANTMQVKSERAARMQHKTLVDQELRVRSALAEMHFRKQDYLAALTQLDALLDMDPTRSTDYYNRARILEQVGRDAEARLDYTKFLTSNTQLPESDERVMRAMQFTGVDRARTEVNNDGDN